MFILLNQMTVWCFYYNKILSEIYDYDQLFKLFHYSVTIQLYGNMINNNIELSPKLGKKVTLELSFFKHCTVYHVKHSLHTLIYACID